MIHNNIHVFKLTRARKGLATYFLQKYCDCTLDHTPTCCPEGWKLVFAGSRFTSSAKTQYSPTEGELLAVTWALGNAKLFILGCKNLTIVTDNKPLLGILNNRDLSSMNNSRLSTLKEKTFQYQFTVNQGPGKWHRADVVLQNTTQATPNALTNSSQNSDITDEMIFITTIKNEFPNICNDLPESIKSYWGVKDRLKINNIILMDDQTRGQNKVSLFDQSFLVLIQSHCSSPIAANGLAKQ